MPKVSKAFTREENEGPDIPDLPARESALPFGSANYLTRSGADRLRDELARLVTEDRPRLVDASSDPDAKRQLARLDQRVAQLEQSLDGAQVISHPPGDADRVTFGATVSIRESSGDTVKYRIVGADETGFDESHISWMSPIARALMGARAGDVVHFETPAGDEQLAVTAIHYA